MTDTSGEDGADDGRQQGVEFGDLDAALESHDYPATVEELLDAYGDHELGVSGGERSLRDVLGPLEAQEGEHYGSAEEVRQMVLAMVGDEAVGREGYSDRGTGAPDASEGDGEESL
jgi:hypothetical protein